MGVVSCCGCCDLEILQVIHKHRGLGRESAVMLKALSNLAMSHGFIQGCPCPPSSCLGQRNHSLGQGQGGGGVPMSPHLIPGPSEPLDLRQQKKVVLPKLGLQAREAEVRARV